MGTGCGTECLQNLAHLTEQPSSVLRIVYLKRRQFIVRHGQQRVVEVMDVVDVRCFRHGWISLATALIVMEMTRFIEGRLRLRFRILLAREFICT
ncbi:hypothetical protein D3C75_1111090 [compost metagenome]